MTDEYRHWYCPLCERVCSVPWEECWCLHHDTTFTPHGARHPELTDWTRMLPHEAVFVRRDNDDFTEILERMVKRGTIKKVAGGYVYVDER